MKISIFSLFIVFILPGKFPQSTVAGNLSPDIYEVIQLEDSVKINAALTEVERSPVKEKDAYKGTLLMKKSGMLKSGMEKLNMFKQGRKLLEGSIKQDSTNAEYRFLRLMIQEQAPDFLNYHSKKEEDAKLIMGAFAELPTHLKEVIKKYSKNSHILKPEDFQK